MIESHLDSGNPGWITIPFSYMDKLNFKVKPVEDGFINTPVARFKKWKATLDGKITIGNINYKNPVINLAEGLTYANIGYQFLKETKITIDKSKNLIKLEKATADDNKTTLADKPVEINDYTGNYGERRIFIEDGKLMLQRGNAPKLELEKLEEDLFKMTINLPVRNELPHIRFNRDSSRNVIGLTFVYKEGREEFVKKDN